MKRGTFIVAFVISAIIACPVAADSKSNPKRPPIVVFYGLGGAAPQTPEEFDEAARKYIVANKITFNLDAAPPRIEVHFSNTNGPVLVQYAEGLHYLKVQFDRDGKAIGHRKGITYVR